MSAGASRFYSSVEGAAGLSQADRVELFVYYLTVELGQDAATTGEVNACFEACGLRVPSRTAAYLSEGAKAKPPRYVKKGKGYALERHRGEEVAKRLGAERVVVQTSVELRSLEQRLSDGPKRDFLRETIDCFEAEANRATVVMAWALAVDHLKDHVLAHRLADFNAALAKETDKRLAKIGSIKVKDDFSDIPEWKLIELLRTAGVISKDVRKILDEKLGTRNSCAHASGVRVKRSKAIEVVEDLVENVVLKYDDGSGATAPARPAS